MTRAQAFELVESAFRDIAHDNGGCAELRIYNIDDSNRVCVRLSHGPMAMADTLLQAFDAIKEKP